ncbi:3-dehydroquinate synthase [Loigolactobacillus backii]|uniref:3-dehydroquinate synthase n=1 Tax=Loigolactobacillus backii TaxID=375175 RepID=UPI000C1CB427|nr:3-dehydroquinate synthase [Loigolactobacillus backii]PIO83727.1 3-dehydroquinate synthase [Loigolactobacillus backii]
MKTVTVTLPAKTYQIKIAAGLLTKVGNEVAKLWSPRKIALVSDSHVEPLYSAQVENSLSAAGFTVHVYRVRAGEDSKQLGVLSSLYEELLGDDFSRSDGVIALGGGVVGDLAGFLASTYMRGISFIQIPTSLLAQVDSSVGGKTGVDLNTGKNLIGTFYQPDVVLIDPTVLQTLSQRFLVEGYAEIVKMAAISSLDFWHLIESIKQPKDILKQAPALIEASVRFKAQIVEADEKEGGLRQILNFGHTLGHAIELLAGGQLAHGEAVSIGMVQITQIFEDRGLTHDGITAKLKKQLLAVGLPISSDLIGSSQFYELLKHDKKNHGDQLTLVYLKELGTADLYPVKLAAIHSFLNL